MGQGVVVSLSRTVCLCCCVPAYDALPKASCPAWVRDNWSKRTPVAFAEEAEAKIEELRSCLTMYENKTEAGLDRAKRAMSQVGRTPLPRMVPPDAWCLTPCRPAPPPQALALDMRSSYRGRGTSKRDDTVYRWDFDRLTVCWTVIAGTIVVCDVEKARRGSGPQQLSPPRRKPKGHLSAATVGAQRRPSPTAAPSTSAPVASAEPASGGSGASGAAASSKPPEQ